ncbi:hypothetical protein JCM10003_473 [Bacteroides pyogenes JCM 10003]|nr:hypothetical protein JCM10003_473 [Bacteroides pyogenes JCM 10003]
MRKPAKEAISKGVRRSYSEIYGIARVIPAVLKSCKNRDPNAHRPLRFTDAARKPKNEQIKKV